MIYFITGFYAGIIFTCIVLIGAWGKPAWELIRATWKKIHD